MFYLCNHTYYRVCSLLHDVACNAQQKVPILKKIILKNWKKTLSHYWANCLILVSYITRSFQVFRFRSRELQCTCFKLEKILPYMINIIIRRWEGGSRRGSMDRGSYRSPVRKKSGPLVSKCRCGEGPDPIYFWESYFLN